MLIAPEGTRHAGDSLARFKLGAFHLSHAANAPVLPVVMHFNKAVWPIGQLAPTPGTVVVDVLPEFSVDDGTPAGLRAAADSLRERYLARLAEGPEDYA